MATDVPTIEYFTPEEQVIKSVKIRVWKIRDDDGRQWNCTNIADATKVMETRNSEIDNTQVGLSTSLITHAKMPTDHGSLRLQKLILIDSLLVWYEKYHRKGTLGDDGRVTNRYIIAGASQAEIDAIAATYPHVVLTNLTEKNRKQSRKTKDNKRKKGVELLASVLGKTREELVVEVKKTRKELLAESNATRNKKD